MRLMLQTAAELAEPIAAWPTYVMVALASSSLTAYRVPLATTVHVPPWFEVTVPLTGTGVARSWVSVKGPDTDTAL